MEQTVADFLQLLDIPISKRYVQKLIQSHPDFPSLLSASDILMRFGIEHTVSRVKKEELLDLAFPYLLPIQKGMGDMLLIKHVRDLDKNRKDLEFWDGVVLQAENIKLVKDKINNELYKKERKIRGYLVGIFSILIISFFALFLNAFNWSLFLLLLTTIVGSTVGYFLVAKDVGIIYKAVDEFCNAGKNVNCDKVLKADLQLWSISFSDAVLTYFLFQTIGLPVAWIFPTINQGLLQALASISLLTIPVVLFSLYYQYFIVKTWCRLCVVVAGVLIIQLVLFLPFNFNLLVLNNNISLVSLMILVFLFLSVGLCVKMIKTMVERNNQLYNEYSGNRIKYSIPVFIHLLKQQNKVDLISFEKEILLGDPDSPVKIIMVSNLYCNPCKEKHEVLEQLVTTYPNQVNVAIRFVKSGKDVNKMSAVGYLLGHWLSHVFGKADEQLKTATLLHQWFLISDLEKFRMKFTNEQGDDGDAKQMEAQHYAWAEKAGIQGTPTFFVNGFQLPKGYGIDDMIAMIPALLYTIEDSNSIFSMHST